MINLLLSLFANLTEKSFNSDQNVNLAFTHKQFDNVINPLDSKNLSEVQSQLEYENILSTVNGFILSSKSETFKLEIEQLTGYLSRYSYVFVKSINPIKYNYMDNINANK